MSHVYSDAATAAAVMTERRLRDLVSSAEENKSLMLTRAQMSCEVLAALCAGGTMTHFVNW